MSHSTGGAFRLRISTFNIRNTTDRYAEREEVLRRCAAAMGVDVVGAQEVSFSSTPFQDQCKLLFDALSKSERTPHGAVAEQNDDCGPIDEVHVFRSTLRIAPWLLRRDPLFRIDGNAIVLSKAFRTRQGEHGGGTARHRVHHLSPYRVVHRVVVWERDSLRVAVANCHLHHIIEDEEERTAQVKECARWLDQCDEADGPAVAHCTLWLGDFNMPPYEPGYTYVTNNGWRSLFHEVHGREPECTFPTGLQAETMDTDGPNTFDYIFYKTHRAELVPLSAERAGITHAPHDATLYPSDHAALVGEVLVRSTFGNGVRGDEQWRPRL